MPKGSHASAESIVDIHRCERVLCQQRNVRALHRFSVGDGLVSIVRGEGGRLGKTMKDESSFGIRATADDVH